MRTYNVYTMTGKDAGYNVDETGRGLSAEDATLFKKELQLLNDFEKVSIYSVDETLSPEDFHTRIIQAMQPIEFRCPHVIMRDGTTWLYSYYETLEAAQAKLKELETDKDNYTLTTWADYDQRQKDSFLGACEEVTKSYYWDLLECLPPMKWGNNNGVQSFFMSEFTSGSYTSQLAEHNGKYYAKAVDYHDKETWIKTSEFENAPFNERSKEWGQ